MSDRPTRIALAGGGAFGAKHVNALKRIDDVEVTAVVSSTLDSATAFAHEHGVGRPYSTLEEILDAVDVTAIVAANDRVAFGVYQAAQERGVRIPDDLSVVSFDDEYLASYLRPALTTLQIPYLEMGRTAMQLVLGGEAPAETLVPMPLQERGSVRDLRG